MNGLPLPLTVNLPGGADAGYDTLLQVTLTREFRRTNQAVNSLYDGTGDTAAGTAAPTAGTYAVGEFVRNTAISELGVVGAKYILRGWCCVTAGTPGTWVEARELTGN